MPKFSSLLVIHPLTHSNTQGVTHANTSSHPHTQSFSKAPFVLQDRRGFPQTFPSTMDSKLVILCLCVLVLITSVQLNKHDKHDKHGENHDRHDRHPKHPKHDHVLNHGRRHGRYKDLLEDPFYKSADDDEEDDDDDDGDWLFDLQEQHGRCNPNPCLNGGVCEIEKQSIKCDCPTPFQGKRCQRAERICKRGKCGHGECLLTWNKPFYKCKCKEPFQPPDCKSTATCAHKPCQNGGSCIKDDMDFDCACPSGFSGRFCHVGPGDCYKGDGQSYRGHVSETEEGDECLHWSSYFLLVKGIDPFKDRDDSSGLGHHNFCRNPDGESRPWCFIRRGNTLKWDHCDVRKCPMPTDVVPTSTLAAAATSKPQTTPTLKPKPKPTPMEPVAGPLETISVTIAPPGPAPGLTTAVPKDPPVKQFSTCGKPQPQKSFNRIYGGLKAIPGAQPWQVSLQVQPKGSTHSYKHICGGVLIKDCWVMTAGHCIDTKSAMQVSVGGLDLGKPESSKQTVQVEQTILHEKYKATPEAVYNDIALLKLKATDGRCLNETQTVKAACLPTGPFPDGKECIISGWGATEESYGSSQLLDAQVLLISQARCSDSEVYGKFLEGSMLCAGYLQGGVDSCQGDSGGPLTCERNGTHFIYGLVSWGDSCGKKNKPGVYTRVTHFVDWINSKIHAA